MNILFLNYEFPPIGGGGSPVSYEIAKGYADQGHTVDVVTMKYKDLPEYEVRDGINIYRVPCLRTKKEICHPWEQLTYLIAAKKFLRKQLVSKKYHINHTHFLIPTGPLALWVLKKYKIPYIVTAHGSDVLGYNKRFKLLYPLLKRPWLNIIRKAAAVTTPSDFLKGKIREITDEGNVITISNGLDLTKFKPMKKEKRILILARLFVNKGIHDILDALKSIDLKGWTVDIVGEGPYRGILEEKVKENNLTDSVAFHGWVDHDSDLLKSLYGRAAIFISNSYFESFGQTALEAISAGCYPLLSDIGGYRSIVNDDKYFFEKENTEQIQSKLENRMKSWNKSFKINIDKFKWTSVIKEYINLLEKIDGTAGNN
jgi:glycosyltransferase involved in cell wall biosynthesis